MHGSRNERRSCPDTWTSSNLAVVLANANVSLQLTSGETLAVVITCWTFLYAQEDSYALALSSVTLVSPIVSYRFLLTFVIRIRSRERPLSINCLLFFHAKRRRMCKWQMIKPVRKIINSHFWSSVRTVLSFYKLESSCSYFFPKRSDVSFLIAVPIHHINRVLSWLTREKKRLAYSTKWTMTMKLGERSTVLKRQLIR